MNNIQKKRKLGSRGIISAFGALWSHLTKRRRTQIIAVLLLSVGASMSEILSLGMLFPLLALIANGGTADLLGPASSVFLYLGIDSAADLTYIILLFFIASSLLSGSARLLLLYASNRLSFSLASELAERVYGHSLRKTYVEHLSYNSSYLLDLIFNKAATVSNQMISSAILFSISSILGVGILIALIATSPYLSVASAAVFSALYMLISRVSRAKLKRNSDAVAVESVIAIRSIQEGLGGIRDVIIDGTQERYVATFRNADRRVKAAYASNAVVAGAPRFFVETIGMILIAILAFFLSQGAGGIAAALPTLGVLALGAQRLLPLLQQGYSSVANMRGSETAIWEVLDYLGTPIAPPPPPGIMSFAEEVLLDNVSFSYPGTEAVVLDQVRLRIPQGARVGIFGPTGSGKSTVLDIIMGLLSPTEGRLVIDGVSVTEANQAQWRRNIAHVPQSIFLTDGTILENIAFGEDFGTWDTDRAVHAAKKAQLHETIVSWPDGYGTKVGERGVRLSGGQRQRIGIARALYKRAALIIFDEATSALDNETEASLIGEIEALGRDVTILMVAHRLTTLRNCDFLIELRKGVVTKVGRYDELIEG